ncbi:MAG TPA: endolytic transglycosylase MltG [Tepidiformaceae bacterium]
MNLTRSAIITGVGVLPVLIAAFFIARTPANVLNGGLVSAQSATPGTDTVDYSLPEGRSAGQIGSDLQKLGVIRSATQFQTLVALLGVQDKLSAGDFVFTKDQSAASVIDQITVKDRVPTVRVTFPEGIRIEEMAAIAEKAGIGTAASFMAAVAVASLPDDLAATLPPGQGLQGYLFPDTYILPVGATPDQLVALMIQTLTKRFTPELRAAAQAHGLNPYQALTLASIVEREAALASERPLIAGVFYNRLAAGDMLGADPTVQFAAALDPASVAKYGYWKKELTIDDLENQSKYNTRLFAGLPPGPIANPGLASIEAVANPTNTKYYYFVADAKKADGSHVFAETFAQHQRNIAAVGSP